MNKREIYLAGVRLGQNVASFTDAPTIGGPLPEGYFDLRDNEVVTAANQDRAWERLVRLEATRAIEQSREWLDGLTGAKPYDPWEVFFGGVDAGAQAYIRRHTMLNA